MAPPRPTPARHVGDAIEASASLAALLAGHRRSQACFEALRPRLPGLLRSVVRPGPIDEGRWTLFAENGAAAAKLRQLAPDLLAAASCRDPGITELKIRIHPRAS